MKFRVLKNDENIYIIELQGRMDLLYSTRLKDLVMKMIEMKIESFIFDLKQVSSIDSAGIGALINISSTVEKLALKLALVKLSEPVRNAIEVTNLSSYFLIASNLREALEIIRPA